MLIGERIMLRSIVEEDWELRFKWVTDPDISATMLSGLGIPLSPSRVKGQIDSFIADPNSVDCVILDKETQLPIGFVHLFDIDQWARKAELGLFIGEKSYHGRGYGTETTRFIVDFAFNRLNLNKVHLAVDADNPAGIRCYEKAGFKTDGVLREEIFKNGKYVDRIVMSVLRHEFINRG